MLFTTLCYIERDDSYLMLHRVRKKNDLNHDKWVGVGGKFEEKESPEECLLREVREETGLELLSWKLRGVVTFVSDIYETEHMYLFTSDAYKGEIGSCDEGDLEWVPKDRVDELPIWEGDKIFFRLMTEGRPFFLLRLEYRGDELISAKLEGRELLPQAKMQS
jgi:8-oxo-dGTP diphosphatase